MIRPVRGVLVPLALLGAAACGRAKPAGENGAQGLTEAQFIDIYVELRRAERQAPTREAFEARREEILARHGATAESLLDFARERGGDVAYMTRIWEAIHQRLTAPEQDSAAT